MIDPAPPMSNRVAAAWSNAMECCMMMIVCSGVTFAIAWTVVSRSRVPLIGFDDANIFFVYARNLAHGAGFVYAPGGERVEGFTSLLWTLLLAPVFRWSSQPERLVFMLGGVLTAGGLAALFCALHRFFCRMRTGWSRYAPLLVMAAWIVMYPEFFSWTVVSMMDPGLSLALNLFLLVACLRPMNRGVLLKGDAVALSVFSALLILERPEAMLFVPAILFLFSLWAIRAGHSPEVRRLLIWPWACFMVSLAGLLVFRKLYFGYFLPNTYYAKVSPERLYNLAGGLKYIGKLIRWNPVVGAAIAASVAGLTVFVREWIIRRDVGRDRSESAVLGVSSAFVLLAMVQVCVGGGEHFGAFRFFQPVWPMFMLSLLLVWPRIRDWLMVHRGRPSRALSIMAVLLAVFSLVPGLTEWIEIAAHGSSSVQAGVRNAEAGRLVGERLNHLAASYPELGPRARVAVFTSGGVAYAYHGPIYDLLGLNLVAMAHSAGNRHGFKDHAAFNRDVFWRDQPEVMLCQVPLDLALTQKGWFDWKTIFPTPSLDSRDPRAVEAFREQSWLKGMEFEAVFRKTYRAAFLPFDDRGGAGILGIFNRTVLDRLIAAKRPLVMIPEDVWLAGGIF